MKDAASNRIVGYSISDRMTSRIAVNALIQRGRPSGQRGRGIVHSDRGLQAGRPTGRMRYALPHSPPITGPSDHNAASCPGVNGARYASRMTSAAICGAASSASRTNQSIPAG